MGIRGSVRRNIDAHIIHSNIDTDVIIAEEPKMGSTRKPEELYSIVEHFCLGRRRLELFGEVRFLLLLILISVGPQHSTWMGYYWRQSVEF